MRFRRAHVLAALCCAWLVVAVGAFTVPHNECEDTSSAFSCNNSLTCMDFDVLVNSTSSLQCRNLTAIHRLNCGGPTVNMSGDGSWWTSDITFLSPQERSRPFATSDNISHSFYPVLHQTERWWWSTAYEAYDLPVTTSGTFIVELHFSESFFNASGQRVFHVYVEGALVHSYLDLFDLVGHDVAFKLTFETQVSDGMLNVGFSRVDNYPLINAITVYQDNADQTAYQAPPPPAARNYSVVRITSGGAPFTEPSSGHQWVNDNVYALAGEAYEHLLDVPTSGELLPMYQTERWVDDTVPNSTGSDVYSIPIPHNGEYVLRFHFAEIYYPNSAPGKRVFDVLVDGQVVIAGLDITAVVGYNYPLQLDRIINVTAAPVNVTISAFATVDAPKFSGIEVLYTTMPPAPTPAPSVPTTAQPTATPTTAQPTATPTTAQPTATPTTAQPTATPTTAQPTATPTTAQPTSAPIPSPTTAQPTATPTTAQPTATPTTAQPTSGPTATPTTAQPTATPTTAQPTATPTTAQPTATPTTAQPTATPTTAQPTATPTGSPTEPAVSKSNSLTATMDTTLYGNEDKSNGGGSHVFVGTNGFGAERRALIRFNVSAAIPTNARVNSAVLRLVVSKHGSVNFNLSVAVHRLTRDWQEGSATAAAEEGQGAIAADGDATWTAAMRGSQNWTSPGGDFVATPSAVAVVGMNGTSVNWTSAGLIQDVQDWVDGSTPDFGWILKANLVTPQLVRRFFSSTGGAQNQPELFVDYTIVPTAAPTQPPTPSPTPVPSGVCCIKDSTSCLTVNGAGNCAGTYLGDNTVCGLANMCPFIDELPIPSTAQPVNGTHYVITMSEFTAKLHGHLKPTTLWGYDGQYPGPTIHATVGVPLSVEWKNDLRDISTGQLRSAHLLPIDTCVHGPSYWQNRPRTIVHVHGAATAPKYDGYPEYDYTPGNSATFVYPNNQRAGTLWYHDHALGITGPNVYLGLAGVYLLHDSEESSLALPDIPLLIQDRSFVDTNGALAYPAKWQPHVFGEVILVNGRVWPYMNVNRTKYRFRVVNGCNGRTLDLRLSNGDPFTLIGTDHGLVQQPVNLTSLLLGSAERAEIVVDFSVYPAGSNIVLENWAGAPYPSDDANVRDVMQFVLSVNAPPSNALPNTFSPIAPLLRESADLVRNFTLVNSVGSDACTGQGFSIDHRVWDDLTEFMELNSTEIWSFAVSSDQPAHPMHLHGVMFQLLGRFNITDAGATLGPLIPPFSHERGWKDTVMAMPGQRVEVILQSPPKVGRYTYHCHMLEHEDNEMMRQFMVTNRASQCNNDTICQSGEDCYSCTNDCGISSGATCGNGLCEVGDSETCASCPADCASNATACCGTTASCSDPLCVSAGFLCRTKVRLPACCGDGICEGAESVASCSVDCSPPSDPIPNTSSPTGTPTAAPTTAAPTATPTTAQPTATPTTGAPTATPTATPTTAQPTATPTTGAPTATPTATPTTAQPTATPTTGAPTAMPTATPTTAQPTATPTTAAPTAAPTTGVPTGAPTAAPTPLPGSVTGRVFRDENNNGLDDSEPGIAGVTIRLVDTSPSQNMVVTSTGEDGRYDFNVSAPGTYMLSETNPAGYLEHPHGVALVGAFGGSVVDMDRMFITVGEGQHLAGYDFGDVPEAKLNGIVFQDGEAGLSVQLQMVGSGNAVFNTSTQPNGLFGFVGLPPDVYTLRLVPASLPAGMEACPVSTNQKGSKTAGGTLTAPGVISNITLTPGATGSGYLLCVQQIQASLPAVSSGEPGLRMTMLVETDAADDFKLAAGTNSHVFTLISEGELHITVSISRDAVQHALYSNSSLLRSTNHSQDEMRNSTTFDLSALVAGTDVAEEALAFTVAEALLHDIAQAFGLPISSVGVTSTNSIDTGDSPLAPSAAQHRVGLAGQDMALQATNGSCIRVQWVMTTSGATDQYPTGQILADFVNASIANRSSAFYGGNVTRYIVEGSTVQTEVGQRCSDGSFITSGECPLPPSEKAGGLGTEVISGIAVGGLLLIVVFILVYPSLKRKMARGCAKESRDSENANMYPADSAGDVDLVLGPKLPRRHTDPDADLVHRISLSRSMYDSGSGHNGDMLSGHSDEAGLEPDGSGVEPLHQDVSESDGPASRSLTEPQQQWEQVDAGGVELPAAAAVAASAGAAVEDGHRSDDDEDEDNDDAAGVGQETWDMSGLDEHGPINALLAQQAAAPAIPTTDLPDMGDWETLPALPPQPTEHAQLENDELPLPPSAAGAAPDDDADDVPPALPAPPPSGSVAQMYLDLDTIHISDSEPEDEMNIALPVEPSDQIHSTPKASGPE